MNKFDHRFHTNGYCIKCKFHTADLIWTAAINSPNEYSLWYSDNNSIPMKSFINIHAQCSFSEDEWIIKQLLE